MPGGQPTDGDHAGGRRRVGLFSSRALLQVAGADGRGVAGAGARRVVSRRREASFATGLTPDLQIVMEKGRGMGARG